MHVCDVHTHAARSSRHVVEESFASFDQRCVVGGLLGW